MKARALVTKTLLTSAQSTEVLCLDMETLMHEKTVYVYLEAHLMWKKILTSSLGYNISSQLFQKERKNKKLKLS